MIRGDQKSQTVGFAGGTAPTPPRDLVQAHAVAGRWSSANRKRSDSMVDSIGHPTVEHIQQIHGLVDRLDPLLAGSVRDPLSAWCYLYVAVSARR